MNVNPISTPDQIALAAHHLLLNTVEGLALAAGAILLTLLWRYRVTR